MFSMHRGAVRTLAIAAALLMIPAVGRAAIFVVPDGRYGGVDIDPNKMVIHVKVGHGAAAHFTLAQRGNTQNDFSGGIRCSAGLLRPPHLDVDGDDAYVIVPKQTLGAVALCTVRINGLGGKWRTAPILLDVQL